MAADPGQEFEAGPRWKVAVEQGVTGIMHGTEPQSVSLGLKEGGMTLTGLEPDVAASQCEIAKWPDVIAKIKLLREQIISGAIKLKDPMMQ